MKKVSFLVFICLAGLVGCKSSGSNKSASKSASPVIQTIGQKPVFTSEFAYVYNKNNSASEDAYTEKSVREYLRLYTNFKLKVRAAEEAGLDTASSFITELDGYKKQLAQPYLTEKNLTEKFSLQAYERLQEEVNASHILVMVAPDASPEDTLTAWKKISEIRQKTVSGEDFGALATKFSEDPSAKTNAGNLGYFTALQMVYAFEDAAYSLKKGETSAPVRTRFGYHIIKLHDKRPSRGEIRCAHLMVRATAGMSESDSLAAREKAFELHKRLKNGEDWNTLAEQFSDDVNSKSKGGELPWFSTGRMIPSFEDAAFSLKQEGDFSEPVLTPYGWHIIKFLERKELPPYAEMEAKIKQKVSRDRSDYYKSATITRLKKENNFKENAKGLELAMSFADSSLQKGTWKGDAGAKGSAELFSINGSKYTIADFFAYAKEQQKASATSSPSYLLSTLYKAYADEENLKYEEAHLHEKHEDYRMLINEYRDGILLFQLMDEKVWSKAIKDTAGLQQYFNANRDKFTWDTRAHAVVYNLSSDAHLAKLKEELKKDMFLFTANHSAVNFETGASVLKDADKATLNKLARELSRNKDLVAEITGKAETKEASGKNLAVSLKRAEAAGAYLLSKGVDSSQVIVKDGGKSAVLKGGQASVNVYSRNVKDLEKIFNQAGPLTLQVTKGTFQKGENEIVDKVEWKTGVQELKKDGRVFYVVISEIEAPRKKHFDEARGLVISEYQVRLEEEWLDQLHGKYPVSINEDEVVKIIKK